MPTRVRSMALVPVLSLAAGIALANQEAGPKQGESARYEPQTLLRLHDANDDGSLSEKEFLEAHRHHGQIDHELSEQTIEGIRQKFADADKNGDNQLGPEELGEALPLIEPRPEVVATSNTGSSGAARAPSPHGDSAAAQGETRLDWENTRVMTADDEEIGQLNAIVRDKETGDLHAVVRPTGGVDVGDEDIVISLGNLEVEGSDKLVLTDQDPATLRQNIWQPDRYETVQQFSESEDNASGQTMEMSAEPTTESPDDQASNEKERGAEQRVVNSGQQLNWKGTAVITRNDEAIGDLQEVVQEKKTGDLYAVVSAHKLQGTENETIAIPMADLKVNEEDEFVFTGQYPSTLANAAYDPSRFNELGAEAPREDTIARTGEQQQTAAAANELPRRSAGSNERRTTAETYATGSQSPGNRANERMTDTGSERTAIGEQSEYDKEDTTAGPRTAGPRTAGRMQSDEQSKRAGDPAAGEQFSASAEAFNPLEFIDRTVYSTAGEELGDVDNIVKSRASNDFYAVISSGGFFGFGEDESIVALGELEMWEDQVVYTGGDSRAALDTPYVKSQYLTVTDESEFQQDSGGESRELAEGVQAEPGELAQDVQQQAREGGQNVEQQTLDPADTSESNLLEIVSNRPGELRGMTVIGADGNPIGEIEEVVASKTEGTYHIIVSSDEVLGLGGEDVAIPAANLTLQGNEARVVGDTSIEAYDENNFDEVEG